MSLIMQVTPGAELPDRTLTWETSSGTPVDFTASPHTFSFTIGFDPPVVKTTGISGSAGGVVTIAFAADETATWEPGTYRGLLWARRTSDSKDREPARITVLVR